LSDRQGSVVDLVDEAGVLLNHLDYGAFGQILAQTNAANGDRFTYTGREYEAKLGLYWYRARWYDPSSGRFMSEDPMGFGAGDMNLWRYVGNAPTNATDPSGKLYNPLNDLPPSLQPLDRRVPAPPGAPPAPSGGAPTPSSSPERGPNSNSRYLNPTRPGVRPPNDYTISRRRIARMAGNIEYQLIANAIAGTILSAVAPQSVGSVIEWGGGSAGARFRGYALKVVAKMATYIAQAANVILKETQAYSQLSTSSEYSLEIEQD
jgi:RHS repeat-associated protein